MTTGMAWQLWVIFGAILLLFMIGERRSAGFILVALAVYLAVLLLIVIVNSWRANR